MQQQTTDIVIIGGGMVGAACAAGLGQLGLQITLLEQNSLSPFQPNSPYDLRISAISRASVDLLQQLKAWDYIAARRVCPYRHLATWELDGFETQFSASDLQLSELGYMVENILIQEGLWQALACFENVNTYTAVKVVSQQRQQGLWQLNLDNGQQLTTRLIIAADGANSKWREIAGIGLHGWQYRQDCLLIVVETELAQQDITWQQFFPSGPRAFLPLIGKQACLVWYDSPAKIRQLQALSNDQLALEIERAFPSRLGAVQVQNKGSFPLTRRHALDYVKNGIVLIGDSAHTINPLAGQGVNLGFKDVKTLLEIMTTAQQKGVSVADMLADDRLLKRYQQLRQRDNLLMQTGMDIFYKVFKDDLLPLKIGRNLGLLLANKCTPLKRQALKYAIGY
ncbi:2-octaprenyl-3-methyl-6-methoxy-1,4-benzoquinol hydroxylase [Mergibacter septicus]|uniref:FAD-dependent monooxygenase n=1 Tax=Mergibacter septicus TaxID=221402 RepID=UPI0011795B1E|nr:FAD-dependent monooxygenase [Mergibacter septicus]AWX13190.1 2-octaprenyl-3-methyl-6-methoxy-1,4-benzoquinol hydroxylase [Mergibacter septicus]